MDNKEGTVARSAPASSDEYIPPEEAKTGTWRLVWEEFKHTCTTRDGLIGDYDYAYLFTPNIWPFNKKYKDHVPPFWYPDGKIPLLLILILGIQHALTMISGIVTPVLAISRGAFYLDTKTVEYLVSAAFITSGIGTLIQITRTRIRGTPFYIGAGILSVIGPTFDIIPITMKYTAPLYARGICPTSESGTKLPCPDAYGKLIGTILVCVWMQFLVSFIPLKKIFPPMVTGNLLLVLGIYLVTTAGESWGGGASCLDGAGIYRLCPNVNAPKPLLWGDPKFIGIGFSVFVTIILIEIVGSPLMKSASIIFGLAVGSAITGALGYWSISTINQAPAVTFLWTSTFKLGVDGTLVLPLMILFICEAMVCMPSIAATSEASGVDTEGIKANTRIQGGILCDATGSLIAALGFTIPMVSHAGNNGVIVVTSNAVSNAMPKLRSCTDTRAESTCGLLCIGNHHLDGRLRQVWWCFCSNALGGARWYADISVRHYCHLGYAYTRIDSVDTQEQIHPVRFIRTRPARYCHARMVQPGASIQWTERAAHGLSGRRQSHCGDTIHPDNAGSRAPELDHATGQEGQLTNCGASQWGEH